MIMKTHRPYYGLVPARVRTGRANCVAQGRLMSPRNRRYDIDPRPAFSYPPHPMKRYSSKVFSLGAIAVCLFAGGADELSLAPARGYCYSITAR